MVGTCSAASCALRPKRSAKIGGVKVFQIRIHDAG